MVVKSLNTNTNNNLIDWLELQDIDLDDLPGEIEKILKGEQIGRIRIVYD